MNTVSNIQAEPGWSTVTGPSIGPAIPQIKTSQVTDGFCTALLVDVTGVPGKYADGMVRSAAASTSGCSAALSASGAGTIFPAQG